VTVIVLGEFAAVVVAVGGAGAVLQKAVRSLRRFGRFLDGWFGDGTAKHPSVPERLEALEAGQIAMKTALDKHVDGDAPTWLAEGQEWGHRLDDQVESLGHRVSALEERAPDADPVVTSS
jgi:hypothetical protein